MKNKQSTSFIAQKNALAFAAALFCAAMFSSCNQDYVPKPKAYPRVEFPNKEYSLYSAPGCPFQFEKPVYSNVERDTLFFGLKVKDSDCWLNVNFKSLNGTINLTYKEIDKNTGLEKLIEDAHKLSFKHSRKANYIDEIKVENDHGVGGILFDVGGDAASNIQFFLTDSNKHFIRGALYFNSEPNSDSMAPIVEFVKVDMKKMLQTFEWK